MTQPSASDAAAGAPAAGASTPPAQVEFGSSVIYANMEEVVFHLGVEGDGRYRFLHVNPAFEKATALPPQRVIGHLVTEVIPEPSCSQVLAQYARSDPHPRNPALGRSDRLPGREQSRRGFGHAGVRPARPLHRPDRNGARHHRTQAARTAIVRRQRRTRALERRAAPAGRHACQAGPAGARRPVRAASWIPTAAAPAATSARWRRNCSNCRPSRSVPTARCLANRIAAARTRPPAPRAAQVGGHAAAVAHRIPGRSCRARGSAGAK